MAPEPINNRRSDTYDTDAGFQVRMTKDERLVQTVLSMVDKGAVERRAQAKENLEAMNAQTHVFAESLKSLRTELRVHSVVILVVIIALAAVAKASLSIKGLGVELSSSHAEISH